MGACTSVQSKGGNMKHKYAKQKSKNPMALFLTAMQYDVPLDYAVKGSSGLLPPPTTDKKKDKKDKKEKDKKEKKEKADKKKEKIDKNGPIQNELKYKCLSLLKEVYESLESTDEEEEVKEELHIQGYEVQEYRSVERKKHNIEDSLKRAEEFMKEITVTAEEKKYDQTSGHGSSITSSGKPEDILALNLIKIKENYLLKYPEMKDATLRSGNLDFNSFLLGLIKYILTMLESINPAKFTEKDMILFKQYFDTKFWDKLGFIESYTAHPYSSLVISHVLFLSKSPSVRAKQCKTLHEIIRMEPSHIKILDFYDNYLSVIYLIAQSGIALDAFYAIIKNEVPDVNKEDIASQVESSINFVSNKIFTAKLSKEIEGFTSYDNKIFVRERIFYDSEHKIPAIAAFMITLLRELANVLRRRYMEGLGKFNEEVGEREIVIHDVGDFLEFNIFGETLGEVYPSEALYLLENSNWNQSIQIFRDKRYTIVNGAKQAKEKSYIRGKRVIGL